LKNYPDLNKAESCWEVVFLIINFFLLWGQSNSKKRGISNVFLMLEKIETRKIMGVGVPIYPFKEDMILGGKSE